MDGERVNLKGKLAVYGEDAVFSLEKGDIGKIGIACEEPEGIEISGQKVSIQRARKCIVMRSPPEIPNRDWRQAWR